MTRSRPLTPEGYLARYPRLCAHITAESLGYAVPQAAAYVLYDAKSGRECDWEWVVAQHDGLARAALEKAIRSRHDHRGYRYELARRVVNEELEAIRTPPLTSWL